MGKRKSAKKPFKGRKQLKVAKVFDCPYCGNKDSVKCYIDKKDAMMATLACERVRAPYSPAWRGQVGRRVGAGANARAR